MIQGIKPGYRPQAPDTSIEADVYFFRRLRQLSMQERIALASAHNRGVKKLCLTGIKWLHKNASPEEIRERFVRAVLAEKFHLGFKALGIDEKMWIQDSFALAGEIHQLLESVNIPYYVSGGVASSIYGEFRSTRDLDLVIEIQSEQIDLLVNTLQADGFYSRSGVVEGIKQGRERMLNVTHTETISNADLYVMDNSLFAASQMSRRRFLDMEGTPNFWVISPEDLVLQKLLWGKGKQSEKQWRDVLGVLKLQGDYLDYAYLTDWAERLDIVESISQAITEAGI
jgi:hypothetical protein